MPCLRICIIVNRKPLVPEETERRFPVETSRLGEGWDCPPRPPRLFVTSSSKGPSHSSYDTVPRRSVLRPYPKPGHWVHPFHPSSTSMVPISSLETDGPWVPTWGIKRYHVHCVTRIINLWRREGKSVLVSPRNEIGRTVTEPESRKVDGK